MIWPNIVTDDEQVVPQVDLYELIEGNRLILVIIDLKNNLLNQFFLEILHADAFDELLFVNLLDIVVEEEFEGLFTVLQELVFAEVHRSHHEVLKIHLAVPVNIS